MSCPAQLGPVQPCLAAHLWQMVQLYMSYTEPNRPMLSRLAAHVQLMVQRLEHTLSADEVGRHLLLSHIQSTQAVPVAADDEDLDGPAGRSRARYDSSLSLAGLDISSPDFDSTGTSEQVQALFPPCLPS